MHARESFVPIILTSKTIKPTPRIRNEAIFGMRIAKQQFISKNTTQIQHHQKQGKDKSPQNIIKSQESKQIQEKQTETKTKIWLKIQSVSNNIKETRKTQSGAFIEEMTPCLTISSQFRLEKNKPTLNKTLENINVANKVGTKRNKITEAQPPPLTNFDRYVTKYNFSVQKVQPSLRKRSMYDPIYGFIQTKVSQRKSSPQNISFYKMPQKNVCQKDNQIAQGSKSGQYKKPSYVKQSCCLTQVCFDSTSKVCRDSFSEACFDSVSQTCFQQISKADFDNLWTSAKQTKLQIQKNFKKQKQGRRVSEKNKKNRKMLSCIKEKKNETINIVRKDYSATSERKVCTKQKQDRQSKMGRYQMQVSREQKQTANEVCKQIEADLACRRRIAHKRDHFVFALSEGVGNGENAVKSKFDLFKDFVWKVNFSNSVYMRNREEGTLKVYVGPGNNSGLVKGLVRRRFWLQLVEKPAADTHFVWTQLKRQDCLSLLPVSHTYQSQPSFIQQPFKKLVCEEEEETAIKQSIALHQRLMKGQDLRDWITYYAKEWREQLHFTDKVYVKRYWNLLRRRNNVVLDSASQHLHNHFECNYYLGNKKALFYCMREYYVKQGKDPFDVLPVTFHVTKGCQDPAFEKFLSYYHGLNEQQREDRNFRNVWIVKPGELTNRGNGISVCSTLDEIKARVRSKERSRSGQKRTFIVQKYIEKPLLYERRKCDLRHYMVMSCVNGQVKGYWYSEGYVRTSSVQFSLRNCKDPFTHLTNDAIQQHGPAFGRFESHNKVSYADFQKHLVTPARFAKILQRMQDIALDAMRATASLLDPLRRQHCFELFGLDFMLDEHLKVYLLEVNTNPCLETNCPLLTKVITGLIDNVLRICVDPLLTPPDEWQPQRKYHLSDHAFEDNKFTLILDCKSPPPSDPAQSLNPLFPALNDIGPIDQEEQEYNDSESWSEDQKPK